jgi:hypothetical protein
MQMAAHNSLSDDTKDFASAQLAKKILSALQGIRYGAVEITVHDGRIVQIERKEKLRLEPPNRPRSD